MSPAVQSAVTSTGTVQNLGGVTAASITPISTLVTSGSSSTLVKQGSLTTSSGQALTYNSTPSSLELSWGAFVMYFASGAVINVPAGNYTWPSLTASTTYYLCLSYNIVTNAVGQAYCSTAPASAQFLIQSNAGDNWVALASNLTLETEPTGGSGG
jgi:hypothetical protein